MARIVAEELWKDPRLPGGLGLIAVTTNAVVTASGALVMGAGAARQARDRIPGIEYEAGHVVKVTGRRYGFAVVRPPALSRVGFGIFQTKLDWRDPSDLDLIRNSANDLAIYAQGLVHVRVRLSYPGIGLGGLRREEVEPLLRVLPDNVTVCYRPKRS